jgi:hypothetical protein
MKARCIWCLAVLLVVAIAAVEGGPKAVGAPGLLERAIGAAQDPCDQKDQSYPCPPHEGKTCPSSHWYTTTVYSTSPANKILVWPLETWTACQIAPPDRCQQPTCAKVINGPTGCKIQP